MDRNAPTTDRNSAIGRELATGRLSCAIDGVVVTPAELERIRQERLASR